MTGPLFATVISLGLVSISVLIHYEVLGAASQWAPRVSGRFRSRILLVIAAAFVAHLLEVALFGVAYFLMDGHLGLGSIEGAIEGGALDFFYFSITTYTTLGVGDLSPRGPMRVVAGIEALSGLVLITWSASFTYLSMEKLWGEHRPSR